MSAGDIFDVIARLRAEGAPFCVATVVRTADVTSAKAGAKAAVTGAGEILGHLGGACLRRAVVAAADTALAGGSPVLIRVRPAGMATDAPDWMQVYDSGCPSRGTADILVEPWRPEPRLIVVGETPIAAAVVAHAALMGMRVTAIGAESTGWPGLAAEDAVVVSSQGCGDAAALRSALLSPAGHVAMIASRRKAAVLRERLVASGVPEDRFDKLSAPAGLDIGGIDPHEIAIAVLAEIVQLRHRARATLYGAGTGRDAAPPAEVAGP